MRGGGRGQVPFRWWDCGGVRTAEDIGGRRAPDNVLHLFTDFMA